MSEIYTSTDSTEIHCVLKSSITHFSRCFWHAMPQHELLHSATFGYIQRRKVSHYKTIFSCTAKFARQKWIRPKSERKKENPKKQTDGNIVWYFSWASKHVRWLSTFLRWKDFSFHNSSRWCCTQQPTFVIVLLLAELWRSHFPFCFAFLYADLFFCWIFFSPLFAGKCNISTFACVSFA